MPSRSRLPAPKRFQSVLEWQYPRAHRYWDDCGKLIATVERTFPGLLCQGLQQNGFHFVGQSKGITAAHFYWDKASISQVDLGDGALSRAATLYWPLVQEGLGISTVTRLGHRTWLCYETDSVATALKFLDGLGFIEAVGPGAEKLGIPFAGGSVLRTKLNGRGLRLEVNAGGSAVI